MYLNLEQSGNSGDNVLGLICFCSSSHCPSLLVFAIVRDNSQNAGKTSHVAVQLERSFTVIRLSLIKNLYSRSCLPDACLSTSKLFRSEGYPHSCYAKITMQVGYLERAHAKRQQYNSPGRNSIRPVKLNMKRRLLTEGRDQWQISE